MSDSAQAAVPEGKVVADSTVEVARRYAVALIDAAGPADAVDSLLEELGEIQRDVLKASPKFAQLLASSRVSAANKDRILVDVFDKRASSLVVRFLRVLNRHERLGLLDVVVREARAHLGSAEQANSGAGFFGFSARMRPS